MSEFSFEPWFIWFWHFLTIMHIKYDLRRGPEGVFQLQGDHIPESLCQGTGEENPAVSRTSESGGTVQFSSRSWNTGLDLYPSQGAGGCMGVCPKNPQMFYGFGEGIRLCPSSRPVGGTLGVWHPGPVAKGCPVPVWPEQELGSYFRQQVILVPSACWTPAGLPFVTGSVHHFLRQNF